MSKQKTCHGCKSLVSTKMPMKGPLVYSCKLDGLVVPQSATIERAIFWRVPVTCQRPDSEVEKSEHKAPESDWVTVEHKGDGK